MREYYSGYFFGKVTLNFNLKKKILTKHQHSKYVLFLLATSSLVIWENEPMVIRCKFLVISYLFWVGGIHLSAKQKKKKKKKIVMGKEKARNTLHASVDLPEKSMHREMFGNKIQL